MSGWERPDRAACFGGSNCLLKSRSNLPVERSLLRWGLPHEPDETQRSKLRSTGGSRHGGDGALPEGLIAAMAAPTEIGSRPGELCAIGHPVHSGHTAQTAAPPKLRPRPLRNHDIESRNAPSRRGLDFGRSTKKKPGARPGFSSLLEAAAVSRSQPLSGQISSGRSAPYDGSSRSCRPGRCSGSAPADGSRRSRSVQPDATRTHHCW